MYSVLLNRLAIVPVVQKRVTLKGRIRMMEIAKVMLLKMLVPTNKVMGMMALASRLKTLTMETKERLLLMRRRHSRKLQTKMRSVVRRNRRYFFVMSDSAFW